VDKDAVASCCFIAEAAAWAMDQGMSLYELLMHIYKRYGLYLERLLSITRKGKEGAEEIQAMMTRFRVNPPLILNGSQVVRMVDYHTDMDRDMLHGSIQSTGLPKSDVLQFFTAAGDTITIRPSGTEPKSSSISGVKGAIGANEDPETVIHRLV
jgi:phosphoglucomutase